MTPEELRKLAETVRPAKDPMRPPMRQPRNQGTPFDDTVWKSYQSGDPFEVTPVPAEDALTIKRTLEKSARFLTRTKRVEVKVSVQTIPIDDATVTIRFFARPPWNTGARAYRGYTP